MHFQNFSLDSLILDPDFIKWAKGPIKEDGSKWIEWASQSAENKRIVEEAREIILELSHDEDTPVQQELAELWSRISASNEAFDNQQTHSQRKGLLGMIKTWQRVAAVVTAFLCVSILAFLFLNRDIEWETSYGQSKKIVLPDGSVVVLNANSSVSYPSKWDDESPREIWLKGEGFFSVTHKSNSQRFVVHTNDLDVQVLGTKFNVNTRRGKTRVILNSGKVKLFLQKEQSSVVEMRPGDLVDFSATQARLLKKAVKASNYSSWVENKLVFEESTLKEVAQVLEDNYGFKITFTDPELAKLSFTGTIDSGNVDLLFTILRKTFNLSIIKAEEKITIKKATNS